jgi:hypothetical protein
VELIPGGIMAPDQHVIVRRREEAHVSTTWTTAREWSWLTERVPHNGGCTGGNRQLAGGVNEAIDEPHIAGTSAEKRNSPITKDRDTED